MLGQRGARVRAPHDVGPHPGQAPPAGQPRVPQLVQGPSRHELQVDVVGAAAHDLGHAQAGAPEGAPRPRRAEAIGPARAHELAHQALADDDRAPSQPVDHQAPAQIGRQGGRQARQVRVRGVGRQAPGPGAVDAPGPQQAVGVHGLEDDGAVGLRPGPAQPGDPRQGGGRAAPGAGGSNQCVAHVPSNSSSSRPMRSRQSGSAWRSGSARRARRARAVPAARPGPSGTRPPASA